MPKVTKTVMKQSRNFHKRKASRWVPTESGEERWFDEGPEENRRNNITINVTNEMVTLETILDRHNLNCNGRV